MRIGFVSACQAFDVHLMHKVHARWPLSALIGVEWTAQHTPWPKQLRRPIRAVRSRVQRMHRERREAAMGSVVSQALFGSPEPPSPPVTPLIVSNREINAAQTVSKLKAAELDILLVSAAPLLRPEVYSQAKFGSVNVHRGFAPHYRGEDTLFWAMYRGDYDRVAVTVHRIDAGVDTGPVFGYGFPRLEPTFDEGRVFAEAAKVSVPILVELLERLEAGPVCGESQSEKGRVFRSRDRTLWRSLAGQYRMRNNPPPAREARIESRMVPG